VLNHPNRRSDGRLENTLRKAGTGVHQSTDSQLRAEHN
jgi:hypothetical protein